MNARNIVAALTVVIVVIGGLVSFTQCGKADRALLARADSLLEVEEGDSAMMILQSIDSTDLSSSNNAYYALLYTQAQYKCYVPITSDSLISIAEKYYRLNDDRKMYARAAAYKGIALMEMGLPTEAIYYVKTAEQMTDSTEFFTLGWLNLRLGELFQMTYADNGEDIEKYKKALDYFKTVNPQSRYVRVCNSYIGQLYRLSNADSAHYYLTQAIELSKIQRDTSSLVYNMELLAGLYESLGDYQKTKELAIYIVNNTTDLNIKRSANLCLGRIYAKLDQLDSATIMVSNVNELYSLTDSINYWNTKYEISTQNEDYRDALEFYCKSTDKSNSILRSARKHSLAVAEKRYDNSRVEKLNEELNLGVKIRNYVVIITVLVALIVVVLGVIVIRRKNMLARDSREFIEKLQLESKRYNSTIDEKLRTESQLKQVLGNQIESIKELLEMAYRYDGNAALFMEKFKQSVRINKLSGSMWRDLRFFVNENYFGIIDYLITQHPTLSDDDLNYLSMMCCGFSYIEITVCLGNSNERSTCNRRIRIAQRMGVTIPLDQYIDDKKKLLANQCRN